MSALVTRRQKLVQLAGQCGDLLNLPAANQLLVQVREEPVLGRLVWRLKQQGFYLVTAVANDERELEDRCFKIYYLFSDSQADLFLMVEYLLPAQAVYNSIYDYFPAVDPFEREMADMFGLLPQGERAGAVQPGSRLRQAYPPQLYPLRRDCSLEEIRHKVSAYHRQRRLPAIPPDPEEVCLPVGPIHSSVIESGRFVFQTAGENITHLRLDLGYTHKGIERLFQSRLTLADGWQLAEQVSGDSVFAHSLAYCQAAEALAGVEPPLEAQLLRGIFLELERIGNHIGDVAALAQTVSLTRDAGEFSRLREQLLRLNHDLTGQRLLRGLNRPGGLILPRVFNNRWLVDVLTGYLTQFDEQADRLVRSGAFRDRTLDVGVLTLSDAVELGVTGMIGRASALNGDYRRDHPFGIYRQPWLQQKFEEASLEVERQFGDFIGDARRGSIYSRFLMRLYEVSVSSELIRAMLQEWRKLPHRTEHTFLTETRFPAKNNYTFAVGYAEGWRGDIIYWLMQDKLGRIYRCKVRDPSLLNWPALCRAVCPADEKAGRPETSLADFPLIHKSFNLSCAGNDL